MCLVEPLLLVKGVSGVQYSILNWCLPFEERWDAGQQKPSSSKSATDHVVVWLHWGPQRTQHWSWPFEHQHYNHHWWPRCQWPIGMCLFLSSRYSKEQKDHDQDLPRFKQRGVTALQSRILGQSPTPVLFRKRWAWTAEGAACSVTVLAVQHGQEDDISVFTCRCTGQHALVFGHS